MIIHGKPLLAQLSFKGEREKQCDRIYLLGNQILILLELLILMSLPFSPQRFDDTG